MNDALAEDRELFAYVAAAHPGVVRTLSLLVDELDELEVEDDALRALGDRIRRVGDTLVTRANRVVIDQAD